MPRRAAGRPRGRGTAGLILATLALTAGPAVSTVAASGSRWHQVDTSASPSGAMGPGPSSCFEQAAHQDLAGGGTRQGDTDPSAGPPDSIEDVATRYRLSAYLRYDQARLTVHEKIGLCNRSERTIGSIHLSILARAFGEFRLTGAWAGGRRVHVSYPNAADILVPLPGGLPAGHATSVDLEFVDRPSSDTSSSLQSSLSRAEGVMRVSDWFPIVSDGHGLRPPGDSQVTAAAERITLDLTTDRRLVVAAPGRLVRHDGLRRIYTLTGARDYAFLVGPHLSAATHRSRGGVTVRAVTPRGADADRIARLAARALDAYDDAYGPYPWEDLVVAPNPRRMGGHEYPGIIFVGTSLMVGPTPWQRHWLAKQLHDAWYGLRYAVAHEVAHQWFYALIGNDQLDEPWVDEAMAEFTAYHFFGPPVPSPCGLVPVSASVWDFPKRTPVRVVMGRDAGCDGYVETVYRRGAAMVDGVLRIMGDEAFFGAVRQLVAKNRFGIISGAELVAAWQQGSGASPALDAHLTAFLGAQAVADGRALLARASPLPDERAGGDPDGTARPARIES